MFTWLDEKGSFLIREAASGRQLERVNVEKRVFDTSIKIRAEATTDGMKQRVENAKVVVDRTAFQTKTNLIFSDGEAIYGLGQHEEGILNYRGHSQLLYQQNMKKAMPILVSTRGYGMLWDTTSLAAFHDDVYGSYFWTDVDDELDFYFIAGPEFDQIVSGIRKLTGSPTLFPRWAFGYVQSKERYRTQQELIDVVREYRERKIPLDCIVQDWCTWKGKWWGDKNPDPERFPDIDALDARPARDELPSSWSRSGRSCAANARTRSKCASADFCWATMRRTTPSIPKRAICIGSRRTTGWFSHGIDAWWCDCTEPFEADWKGAIKPEPAGTDAINTDEVENVSRSRIHQRVFAAPFAGDLRASARHDERQARREPHALRLPGPAALRRDHLVRRYRSDVVDAANSRSPMG